MKKVLFGAIGILAIGLLANFGLNLDNQAEAGWQPGDWLNQAFWDGNPSDGNIIYALYGDGNPGSTPYNQNWTDGCLPNNVKRIPSEVPLSSLYTPDPNTIYLIDDGDYLPTNLIKSNECSAIIGLGNVNITQNAGDALFIQASNTIIDNLKINGNTSSYGVYFSNINNSTINNVEILGSRIGLRLMSSSNNNINNIKSHNNIRDGIAIFNSSVSNIISNSQTYNNNHYGISIYDFARINTINNSISYNNNGYGFAFWGNADAGSINNSQAFNNAGYGIGFTSINGMAINNCDTYNNTYGLSLDHSSSGYINNLNSYNNLFGMENHIDTNISLFGNINFFNNSNVFLTAYPYTGGWNNFNTIVSPPIQSWLPATIDDNNIILSYYRLTNPINANGDKFLSGTNRTSMRGTGSWISNEPTKYIFGKNMLKQIKPVMTAFDGINPPYLTEYGTEGLDYDTTEYIAQVNMELSPEDESIVDYYYGPNSEFTVNWDENNCSQGAFTVEHITNQSELNSIAGAINHAIGHTIYVIEDGEYTLSQFAPTIEIEDNCIAIVAEGTGVKLSANTITNPNSLIHIKGQENIIIDDIELNGANRTEYGINLDVNGSEKSINNTLNNIKSYNHTKNGIMFDMGSEYNTIMNSQMFNNDENGIEIYYAGNYNVINNSLAYNNGGYGIRFGNGSKYNTINNGQFFNNTIGGIFADFTTQQNIINNVHAYNNAGYGLNFKRSSGNVLNNIYAYNNNTGINMTDVSCIGNTYNDELVMFGNNTDFAGTNGTDIYLDSAAADGGLGDGGRFVGSINTGAESMSCDRATNGRSDDTSPDTRYLSGGLDCIETGVITSWDAAVAESNIDYMFGQFIGKQAMPVGYSGINIINLDTQYDDTQYIGVVNEIIWTDPGMISITMVSASGSNTGLELAEVHELSVNYGTSMINENFDIELTLDPTNTDGYIAVKTGGLSSWINMGTSVNNIDFNTLDDVALMIRSANGYYEAITGSLYIGTTQYGSSSQSFTMRTKPNPTPPTITWTNNIDAGGIWYMQSNDWQADMTGVYTLQTRAKVVTGSANCNSGIAVGSPNYNGSLVDIISNAFYDTFDGKYICIYTKDTINGQDSHSLSNQIKISKLEFNDDVATGPIYYDVIDVNFQNLYNNGYIWVNTGSECGTGLSGMTLNTYNGPIVLNSDMSYNGKYLCAYGEDHTGSGHYLLSSNDVNISNYGNTVNLSDGVENSRVSSDTISAFFSSSVVFDQKKYKFVDLPADCDNTGSMQDYTGSIIVDNESLNDKYFCLYTHEQVSGIENYLLSQNSLKVDITSPTTPQIQAPLSGEDVTFLVVEAYGASDNKSGLKGYEYQIAKNATFLDIVASGTYITSGTEIIPTFDDIAMNYVIKIRAIDEVGNTSARSNIVNFDYQMLNNFEFNDITGAIPDEVYTGNEITIAGLDTNETIFAGITNGVLYRNGVVKGSGTLVQNDDKLFIEMFSSPDFDTTVSTELVIANRILPWSITTATSGVILTGNASGCNLSITQKLSVLGVYNSIIDNYSGTTQFTPFLITMQSMIEDNITLAGGPEYACNLSYMLDLVNNELGVTSNPTNTHITPSCKEYSVDFDTTKQAYYSPDMINVIYFGSRDDLGKYLDSKNPGDCHVNSYGNASVYNNTDPLKHIAPNGKVYTIVNDGVGYTSPEFMVVKYFASIGELRAYIDRNNPAIAVWDHQVDATFTPVDHTAPNGKTYKIYKTNRGYMSYKFLSVKYFGSFDEIVSYIDVNNG